MVETNEVLSVKGKSKLKPDERLTRRERERERLLPLLLLLSPSLAVDSLFRYFSLLLLSSSAQHHKSSPSLLTLPAAQIQHSALTTESHWQESGSQPCSLNLPDFGNKRKSGKKERETVCITAYIQKSRSFLLLIQKIKECFVVTYNFLHPVIMTTEKEREGENERRGRKRMRGERKTSSSVVLIDDI